MRTFLNKIVLSGVIIMLLAVRCGERSPFGGEDDKLIIDNNSSIRLYIYPQLNYPDTTISSYNPSHSKIMYEVLANSEKRITSRSWEQLVTASLSDTLMMFIYDADQVDTTAWDVVVSDYLILKRYDLSLKDLQGMNWTLTYP